ncbi:MAG: dihydroorotase [Williamsia sp.]|nr:dihydroorotase [Williamsia sp.]
MKVLLQQAAIIDPASPFHQSKKDILIHNGTIQVINDRIEEPADTVIREDGLCVSPGWIDSFADFGDPGYEHKETLQTGAQAAAAGGFVSVMIIPNTKPAIDNRIQVEYIVQRSAQLPVNVLPLGAITKGAEGKELAEMYDMQGSGAVAFTDGTHPVQSAGILLKALQYVKPFHGVIIQLPDDKSLVPHGLMHEGIVSTQLGLPGKPALSEELLVARDIRLLEYTGSRLHFTAISSALSLPYIREAKQAGLQVSCSVTPYHLFFCDEDLQDYDTHLKVNPPLRSREDMMALRQAVVDGVIDCIATHHLPQDYDSKIIEFEYARPGMTGLETCYPVLKAALPGLSEERWVELLSTNPAAIFGIKPGRIATGEPAQLTLFNPTADFLYGGNIRSKSANSPFIGRAMKGRIAGIVNGNKLFLNNQPD